MQQSRTYKYSAFISYQSKDQQWGEALQRKLEHFKIPTTISSEKGWKRTPIKPVFFAPNEIQIGDLDTEIKSRINDSKNLIVVCSPNSAKSEWVGKEIEYFYNTGRKDNIYFFIIEGIPNSENSREECYNKKIKELGLDNVLGADINFHYSRFSWVNRERAYVQLITSILGVEFDSIWQRHKRQMMRTIAIRILCLIIALSAILGVWQYFRSDNVNIFIEEIYAKNPNLPPLYDAVITLNLENEAKTDSIALGKDMAIFTNVPHRFFGKPVKISFSATNYQSVDTTMILKKNILLPIARDVSVFGNLTFELCDENMTPVTNQLVSIAGIETYSDENGNVKLQIPIEKQAQFYIVKCDRPLQCDTLDAPCSENSLLICK